MKKRIVCVLLTLIMLLSLVPMTASAATRSTSEAAITVLKQMTKLKTTCEHYSGEEFRNGYGTVCEEKGHVMNKDGSVSTKNKYHTITEAQADEALRKALKKLDTKINNFASTNGVTLSQNEHDALVVFTFGAGESWLNGTGVLKNVIVKGTESNELLNAMSLWGNMDRRKVEANMYLNGVYSNTIPSNYSQVTYDANGGTLVQHDGKTNNGKYTMQFDASKVSAHTVKVSRNGYQFLGWYFQEGTSLRRAPDLRYYYKNGTLKALWQANGASSANALVVDYEISSAMLSDLNVYDAPEGKVDTKKKVETTMKVDRDYLDADGDLWSHLKAGGWVKVGKHTNSSGNGSYINVTVTVTNSYVNRRVNATALSAKNGSYNQGDQLLIIAEDGGWGQVGVRNADGSIEAVGWVSLVYTNWGSVNESASSTSSPTNTIPLATATVTFNGYLNLRNEAGTDGKIVGALAKNESVTLYEIKTVNGHRWGRCSSGWLCLTYTNVSMAENVTVSDEGALAYTFTGVAVNSVNPRVAPGTSANYAQFKDADGKTWGLTIQKGKAVTLTNLAVVNGETWAKATWKNDEKKIEDKKYVDITVSRSGWVKLTSIANARAATTCDIELDPAKYTVAADSINARTGAGNEYALAFSLNKGTEVEVNEITLVGENIWGLITVKNVVESGTTGDQSGWINLASKYVSRGDLPTVDTSTPSTGKVGTVINTDSVRVRSTGATYGNIVGSLSRGTTVAVWESADGWHKVDSNKNGAYDYEGDGWVSGSYLDVHEGTVGGSQTITDNAGNSYQTDGTGTGVVANTYSGVKVRSGAGTGNAQVGTLLNGTVVEILETTTVGAAKWGRVAQGWICMDYVTMLSYNEVIGEPESNIPEGGIQVDSFADAERTSTTAVYTGKTTTEKSIFKEPDLNSEEVRVTAAGENITIHELSAVTQTVEVTAEKGTDANGTTTVTTKKTTTYWARVNDGWIYLPAGSNHIALDALDEKVHTVTGSDSLNVRKGPSTSTDSLMKLKRGDQVTVTELVIENDKVWGRIETAEKGTGYVRLDYLSEGAIYEKEAVETAPSAPVVTPPVIGNTGNTGGYVTNAGGYRYTGKVINTNELNVRAYASTGADVTTTLKSGAALVIYETTIAENMAWGRCDAGWVYLYYVDLVPAVDGAVDSRVVYQDNTVIYTDVNCSGTNGTYARMQVIDIYEIVGKMARTDLGWVNTDNLL